MKQKIISDLKIEVMLIRDRLTNILQKLEEENEKRNYPKGTHKVYPIGQPAKRSLTAEQVLAIKQDLRNNQTVNHIAKKMNLAHGVVNAIKLNKTYKEIK